MSNNVMLADWTGQAMRAIEGSPMRIGTARKQVEPMGGHCGSVFMTMGEYDDLVITCDAPDERRRRGLLLAAGQAGNIQTKSMKKRCPQKPTSRSSILYAKDEAHG